MIDDNIAAHVLTVDVDIGATGNIGLTGPTKDVAGNIAGIYLHIGRATHIAGITTTVDITANGYLTLHRRSSEEHQ